MKRIAGSVCVLATLAAAAFVSTASAASFSSNNGTALSVAGISGCETIGGQTVVTAAGSVTTSSSNTTVAIFLTVDSTAAVQVGQITGSDFVANGRFKSANFLVSSPVTSGASLTLSFVQSGSDGRLSKTVSIPLAGC